MRGKGKAMAFQSGNTTTLISRESEIIGDVKFSGDLEIQGIIRGNIYAKADKSACVRIVEGGQVEGEIHAPKIIVNGEIRGDIHSSEHVELAAKASIEGNIHYTLIEMVKGAQLNGSLIYTNAAKQVKAGKGSAGEVVPG